LGAKSELNSLTRGGAHEAFSEAAEAAEQPLFANEFSPRSLRLGFWILLDNQKILIKLLPEKSDDAMIASEFGVDNYTAFSPRQMRSREGTTLPGLWRPADTAFARVSLADPANPGGTNGPRLL
jgi:hypothetical protein